MIPPMSFNCIWVPRLAASRGANLVYVKNAGYWDPAVAEQLGPYLEFARSLAPSGTRYSHNRASECPESPTMFNRRLIREGLLGCEWALALLCTGFTIRVMPDGVVVALTRTVSPHGGVSKMPQVLIDYYKENFQ